MFVPQFATRATGLTKYFLFFSRKQIPSRSHRFLFGDFTASAKRHLHDNIGIVADRNVLKKPIRHLHDNLGIVADRNVLKKPIRHLHDNLGIVADPNYYINLEAKFGAINYKPLPVVIERARDCHVWDVRNRRYLDFTASYATVSQGHCHPKIRAAAIAQMEKVTLTSRVFYNTYLAEYQKRMCETLGFERYFMANGGCEAAESSWKMARAWGYLHKKIPRNEAIIVFPDNNFTGRSIAAASASTDPKIGRAHV